MSSLQQKHFPVMGVSQKWRDSSGPHQAEVGYTYKCLTDSMRRMITGKPGVSRESLCMIYVASLVGDMLVFKAPQGGHKHAYRPILESRPIQCFESSIQFK